jgi:uncharacterized protein YjiK
MLSVRSSIVGLIAWVMVVGLPAAPQAEAGVRCSLEEPSVRWALPRALSEVSGLAVTSGGKLVAHGDERARVLFLDPASGRELGHLDLRGKVRGDFEGVAASDSSLALMTSTGRLYFFFVHARAESTQVSFRAIETGLGRLCEMEGLAWDTPHDQLLIPCKNGRTAETMGGITIYRWTLGTAQVADPIHVSPQALLQAIGTARINATAVDLDPVTGNLVLLSSRPAVLLTLAPDGRILGAARLRPRLHPRPEGLAVTREAIYIGDEGLGGRGTIARYDCGPSR